MSFRIAWHRPALITFYKLPMHTAMIVDRAVLGFAQRGEGHVERDPPYFRLRAGFYDAVFTVDREQRLLTVLRLYRR